MAANLDSSSDDDDWVVLGSEEVAYCGVDLLYVSYDAANDVYVCIKARLCTYDVTTNDPYRASTMHTMYARYTLHASARTWYTVCRI